MSIGFSMLYRIQAKKGIPYRPDWKIIFLIFLIYVIVFLNCFNFYYYAFLIFSIGTFISSISLIILNEMAIEDNKKLYLKEVSNEIKDILQYELQNQITVSKSELIRVFKLSFDDANKYLKILNSPAKYRRKEIPELKKKAEEVLKKLEKPTIYGLMNEFECEFDTAKKVIKFISNEGLAKSIPKLRKENKEQIHRKEQVSRKENELTIFLSYSTTDSGYFRMPDIAKALESYTEIDKILYWEADSGENIVEYMEKTLKECNVFVLFCSENALNSLAVTDEWQAAFQLRKKGLLKIVPVYEDEKFIPALLTPLLNVKFSKDSFIDFIVNLYHEILRE